MRKLAVYMLIIYAIQLTISPAYASNPTSESYELRDYSFGAGGGTASSEDFSFFGSVGEVEYGQLSSEAFKAGNGLTYTLNSYVPSAPSFTNPSSWYNKLQLILDNGGSPSDTLFAIAISTDNFATETRYIQNDNTVGNTLGAEDWQTYSAWGGASGIEVIGLTPGTTYTVKVTAFQGDFSQSSYGPTAQAATDNPTLSFDIDIASTDTESSAPYSIDFGSLSAGSVSTANDKIWLDLSTNALSGGYVYIYDQYGGLRSTNLAYTITSVSTNLAGSAEGYGLQSENTSQSSGGPLTAVAPYDGTNENVGLVDTTVRELYNTSNNPISGGRASILLKAKASNTTPAANDYADTITIIASGTF